MAATDHTRARTSRGAAHGTSTDKRRRPADGSLADGTSPDGTPAAGSSPDKSPPVAGADGRSSDIDRAGAPPHGVLRDIRTRLLVAYATCVTAQQALLAQNGEHDREIARCLRWGVADVLSAQADVLGTACSTPAASTSTDDDDSDDTPAVRRNAVRST
jgi:hypothetical protein